jgi:hypothetical protein
MSVSGDPVPAAGDATARKSKTDLSSVFRVASFSEDANK